MGTGIRLQIAVPNCLSLCDPPKAKHPQPIYAPTEPSKLDYIRVTSSFFAVSKYKGDRVLYRRCNFERQPARMHCIDLSYPAREERAWDQTVTRISRSLRPLLWLTR